MSNDEVDINNGFDDVGDFHERFGLDNTSWHTVGPREVPADVLEFRLNFLLEELTETIKAAGGHFKPEFEPPELSEDGVPTLIGMRVVVPGDNKIDHAGVFDGLIDLVYVAYGTAHFMGYPWTKGWRLVQRANMAKVRANADASNSLRGHALDVVKPEGWKAPDIAGLLKRYGWSTK
jgi:predicted HAD superfamily Cof-like phosphohydrolase